MEALIIITLAIFGAVLGSFACCQTHRIKNKDKSPHSHCLHCNYTLKWYDNIPIISYLILHGRCRKCHHPIGRWEIVSELTLAILFPLTYLLWPNNFGSLQTDWWSWALLVLLLTLIVGFAILFIYDARWSKLPTKALTFCTVCATLMLFLHIAVLLFDGQFSVSHIVNLALTLLILPGLYLILYKISDERWVGSGDWLVALPIALTLGHWWLALCTVFLANLIGTGFGIRIMTRRRTSTTLRIPFGPFLILAFVIVFLTQDWLLSIATF